MDHVLRLDGGGLLSPLLDRAAQQLPQFNDLARSIAYMERRLRDLEAAANQHNVDETPRPS